MQEMDFDNRALPDETTFVRICDDVYMFMRPKGGPNAAIIVTDAGLVAIDTLTTPAWAREAIAQYRTVSNAPFRYLLITHEHSDHVFGAKEFCPPAEIIAHRALREHYANNLDEEFEFRQGVNPNVDLSEVEVVLPHITFAEDGMELHVGNKHIRIMYWGPAQTQGGILFHLPERNLIFTGDVFNYKSVNYMGDMASYQGWLDVLSGLDELNCDYYVGGHGFPGRKEDIAEYRSMLTAYNERVRDGVEQGRTLDDLLENLDFSEFSDYRNFERWTPRNITALCNQMTSEK